MRLSDGTFKLCSLENIAEDGHKPVQVLVAVDQCCYEERSLGYNRIYVAMGQGQQIERVVRTWPVEARPGMYAVTEDGTQWRIATVQRLQNDDGLPCMDLSLERLGKLYELSD